MSHTTLDPNSAEDVRYSDCEQEVKEFLNDLLPTPFNLFFRREMIGACRRLEHNLGTTDGFRDAADEVDYHLYCLYDGPTGEKPGQDMDSKINDLHAATANLLFAEEYAVHVVKNFLAYDTCHGWITKQEWMEMWEAIQLAYRALEIFARYSRDD